MAMDMTTEQKTMYRVCSKVLQGFATSTANALVESGMLGADANADTARMFRQVAEIIDVGEI